MRAKGKLNKTNSTRFSTNESTCVLPDN